MGGALAERAWWHVEDGLAGAEQDHGFSYGAKEEADVKRRWFCRRAASSATGTPMGLSDGRMLTPTRLAEEVQSGRSPAMVRRQECRWEDNRSMASARRGRRRRNAVSEEEERRKDRSYRTSGDTARWRRSWEAVRRASIVAPRPNAMWVWEVAEMNRRRGELTAVEVRLWVETAHGPRCKWSKRSARRVKQRAGG